MSDIVFTKENIKNKQKNEVVSNSVDIISDELKRIGIKRLNELIKLAESKNNLELFTKLAQYDQIRNPNDLNDKAIYATKQKTLDEADPLIEEFANFFINIKNNCKKMKKAYVYSQSSEDEPIGHAFRLVVPAKKLKGNLSCNHYTIAFRLDLNGELLVTEWYSMSQNSDCQ